MQKNLPLQIIYFSNFHLFQGRSESGNEIWKNQKMKNEIKIWHTKLIARNPSSSNILVLYVAIYR